MWGWWGTCLEGLSPPVVRWGPCLRVSFYPRLTENGSLGRRVDIYLGPGSHYELRVMSLTCVTPFGDISYLDHFSQLDSMILFFKRIKLYKINKNEDKNWKALKL